MEKAAQSLGRLQTIPGHGLAPSDIDLRGANLQGFDLQGLHFEKALMARAQMQGANLIGAKMQGADLCLAQMQGAKLTRAQMDANTSLTNATLRGASVSEIDDTTIAQLRPFWPDIFADGGTQLPNGETRPAHWVDEELDYPDFVKKWRAWQATLPPE